MLHTLKKNNFFVSTMKINLLPFSFVLFLLSNLKRKINNLSKKKENQLVIYV